MSRITYLFALAWTLGVTIYLAVVPMYGERKSWVETRPNGETFQVVEPGTQTLADVNGSGVLLLLAIPLALVVLPVLFRRHRRRKHIGMFCAGVLLVLAFLGSASIGMYYYPSALALLIAVASDRAKPVRPRP